MKYDVPFVPNTDDDLHCLQAAFMMILKYFKPSFEIGWDEWSEITGFEKDKGTYTTAGLLWFISNGFDVKSISLFDVNRFIEIGGDYFIELSGKEVGEWQIKHSNIPIEQDRLRKLLDYKVCEQREPTIEDIKDFLDNDYLVRAQVNAYKLNQKEGYFGHSVVVSGYDHIGLIIQDPGLPPLPNRRVGFEEFKSAWADPTINNKDMDVIRLSITKTT
jgi:hypothetical protein